jgi:hypothetical protein
MPSNSSPTAETSAAKSEAADSPRAASVQWHDQQMQTHFANVVNVQSTREQFDLFFGTNQTWNVTDKNAVAVNLSNRVILTPLAAKRLWTVLGNVLREHEARHGTLELDR